MIQKSNGIISQTATALDGPAAWGLPGRGVPQSPACEQCPTEGRGQETVPAQKDAAERVLGVPGGVTDTRRPGPGPAPWEHGTSGGSRLLGFHSTLFSSTRNPAWRRFSRASLRLVPSPSACGSCVCEDASRVAPAAFLGAASEGGPRSPWRPSPVLRLAVPAGGSAAGAAGASPACPPRRDRGWRGARTRAGPGTRAGLLPRTRICEVSDSGRRGELGPDRPPAVTTSLPFRCCPSPRAALS